MCARSCAPHTRRVPRCCGRFSMSSRRMRRPGPVRMSSSSARICSWLPCSSRAKASGAFICRREAGRTSSPAKRLRAAAAAPSPRRTRRFPSSCGMAATRNGSTPCRGCEPARLPGRGALSLQKLRRLGGVQRFAGCLLPVWPVLPLPRKPSGPLRKHPRRPFLSSREAISPKKLRSALKPSVVCDKISLP